MRFVIIFWVDDLILYRYWNGAHELAISIDSKVNVQGKLEGKAVSSSYDPSGKSENYKDGYLQLLFEAEAMQIVKVLHKCLPIADQRWTAWTHSILFSVFYR